MLVSWAGLWKELWAPLRYMIAESSRENATLHWRIEGLAVGLVHSAWQKGDWLVSWMPSLQKDATVLELDEFRNSRACCLPNITWSIKLANVSLYSLDNSFSSFFCNVSNSVLLFTTSACQWSLIHSHSLASYLDMCVIKRDIKPNSIP